MTEMTDRAQDALTRGIRQKAELATVEDLTERIKAAATMMPKAAAEAGVMPGDPMHDLLSTLGAGFAAWGDLLTAHAKQLEEMTVAARSAADSEVTRARTQIGEIEAEAVQHITEGITEAANRVMERRTARLELSLAIKVGSGLGILMLAMLGGGYLWGRRDALAEVTIAERQVAEAFHGGPDAAMMWAQLMRNNDLKASLARCTGTGLLVQNGRKACAVPLWIEGPGGAP
jgi:hypothetical protein